MGVKRERTPLLHLVHVAHVPLCTALCTGTQHNSYPAICRPSSPPAVADECPSHPSLHWLGPGHVSLTHYLLPPHPLPHLPTSPPCSYNLTAAPAVSGWSQHPLPLPPAATSLGGSLLTVHHDEASGHTLVTSQGVQASLLLEGCLSGMGAWRVCAIDAVLWRPPPPPPPPPALDSVATTPATATVQEAV